MRRIDTVRIQVAGQDLEIPWTLAEQLRRVLVSLGEHTAAEELVNRGKSDARVLDAEGKRALLTAVWIRMQTGSDEQAQGLLELRNALIAEGQALADH
jgi:hypothetical protein